MSDPEIFDRPPRGAIPLSIGGDLVIDFIGNVEGVPVAYAAGVNVTLVVDAGSLISATAVINGFHAVCKIESVVADTISEGSHWRCIVSYPTTPTTEVVAMNGTIVRAD